MNDQIVHSGLSPDAILSLLAPNVLEKPIFDNLILEFSAAVWLLLLVCTREGAALPEIFGTVKRAPVFTGAMVSKN